jgi:uncharacterized protein YndB with AHSA1/START domain
MPASNAREVAPQRGDAMNEAPFEPKVEFVLTRIFNAPRKLVFQVWTDPKHLAQWWGLHGFTTEIRELDVRPGGAWRDVMHGPDGEQCQFDGTYVEIVAPEKLVFEGFVFGDPEQRVRTKVTFTELGDRTEIRVRQLYSFESASKGAPIGWSQTFERLEEFLAKL